MIIIALCGCYIIPLFSGLEAFAYYWAKKTGVVKEYPPGLICNKCQYLVSSEPCPTCKKCGNLTPKKPRDLPVSTVIYEFLKEDGEVFGATDGLKANTAKKEYDPYAAMAAYAHLRNKLVHENKVSSNSFKNDKNIIVPLNMFHYLDRLEKLVQLVILKKVGFDDDGTNYKAWLNLQ